MTITIGRRAAALLAGAALPILLAGPAMARAEKKNAASQPAADAPQNADNRPTTDYTATGPDIVVTAQKRSERLLDVPVAVTALPADQLVKENIVRLQDFATRVPGLSVPQPVAALISIRGINAAPSSPTVATTIDDVPFGTTSWSGAIALPDLDPSDIQQIEILRGPQGTLYGASSLGGLIKYVTRSADPDKFSGRVEAGINQSEGGSAGYSVRGAVNIPLVSDKLAIRASAYKRWDPKLGDRFDPTGNHGLLAADVNDSEYSGYRVAAFAHPFDALTINVSHLQQINDFTNSSATIIDRTKPLYTPLYGYFGNDSGQSVGRNKTTLTEGRVELALGPVTLTSVSGWTKLDMALDSDSTRSFSFVLDGFPPFLPPVYPNQPAGTQVRLSDGRRTTKFSQEIRLASNGGGPLEWLVGGFYTNERSALNQEIYVSSPSGSRVGSVVIFPIPSTYREWAAFGDVTYHFTDRFQLQVGGRYSKNKQTYVDSQVVVPAAEALFGPTKLSPPTHSKDDSFTFLVSPSYKITPDVMVYARVATGYRPGGPNTAAAPQPSFGPDRVTNYEVGLKGRLLDRKLTIDTSVFDIEWRDVQLSATTLSQLPYFLNGGRARSRGWEAAADLQPGAGWAFNANLTLLDAVLTEDLPKLAAGANYLLGKAGDPLPYSAKFSSNLGFEKKWDVSGVDFFVGGNWSHVGKRDALFRQSLAAVARQGKLKLPAYDLVDLRTGISHRGWDVTLFVRNILNERGLRDAGDGQGLSGTMTATYVQPRTVGVNVSYAF